MPAGWKQRGLDLGRVADHLGDGDRLAERSPEAEDDGADDARASQRQHGHADHLPARGPQRVGALLELGRRRPEHLAGDRGDDRQRHDREDQRGVEHPVGRVGAREQRDPAQEAVEERLEVVGEERPQDDDPPQSEDHAGDRRQQLDQDRHRTPDEAGGQLGEVDRDQDRRRGRDDQRDHRADERPVDERGGAELVGDRIPGLVADEGQAELRERRPGLVEDRLGDPHQQGEREQPGQPADRAERRLADPVDELDAGVDQLGARRGGCRGGHRLSGCRGGSWTDVPGGPPSWRSAGATGGAPQERGSALPPYLISFTSAWSAATTLAGSGAKSSFGPSDCPVVTAQPMNFFSAVPTLAELEVDGTRM